MKINELARLTGLNAETIRKYRNKGLLRPHCCPENGYYDYSATDFLNLLYIRKLRGANLSLDTIASTYAAPTADELLDSYRATVRSLDEQIEQLRKKARLLRLHMEHLERDTPSFEDVHLIEARAAKYDSYFGDNIDPARVVWVENIDLFIQVLCISREYLTCETLPERVPDAVFFPEGRYASFFLTVEDTESIDAAQLGPIRDFLRTHRLCPETDTTAYLYRVDSRGDVIRFIFCVRVKVNEMKEETV